VLTQQTEQARTCSHLFGSTVAEQNKQASLEAVRVRSPYPTPPGSWLAVLGREEDGRPGQGRAQRPLSGALHARGRARAGGKPLIYIGIAAFSPQEVCDSFWATRKLPKSSATLPVSNPALERDYCDLAPSVLDPRAQSPTYRGRDCCRGASDGTIIRELSGVLRPAIRHAIDQRRLVPGVYFVPRASGTAGARLLDHEVGGCKAALGDTPRPASAAVPAALRTGRALYGSTPPRNPRTDLEAGGSRASSDRFQSQRAGPDQEAPPDNTHSPEPSSRAA
jgi:hypothetical protein